MGKQYYCEFCDKSFADNPTNRRNHLRGSTHQQMKRTHYAAFRDAATILAEESEKRPCRKFLTTGFCDYGNGCKYSHMTDGQKVELQAKAREVAAAAAAQRSGGRPRRSCRNASFADWLAKWTAAQKDGAEGETAAAAKGGPLQRRPGGRTGLSLMLPPPDGSYQLPPCLAALPSLPPSLIPPSREAFMSSMPEQWG